MELSAFLRIGTPSQSHTRSYLSICRTAKKNLLRSKSKSVAQQIRLCWAAKINLQAAKKMGRTHQHVQPILFLFYNYSLMPLSPSASR